MNRPASFFILILCLVAAACQVNWRRAPAPASPLSVVPPVSFCAPKSVVLNTAPGRNGALTPLFAGLTEHFTYPVTTQSAEAQKFFDQGLMLAYGFNHAEAARSFREAARLDPSCAMAYWGVAYVLGPNYNAGMDPTALPHALEAIAQARLRMHTCTPKERALIEAVALRYPKQAGEDPKPHYQAYAEALKAAWKQFPDDPDLAAMTAEALMDMHPWDLWEKNGMPKPWTPEIMTMLENILAEHPLHAQAVHLYVHATEASGRAEKALPYANALRTLVPGSGHLVHMPSHTYINTGHYHEGAVANERAVRIDSAYVEACHAEGVYPLAYYPHNWHFLAACAALEGRGDRALSASRYMAAHVVDEQMLRDPTLGTLQHYYTIPWYIQVKFARWDEILREPRPADDLTYPLAIWHYARGMALAASNQPDGARQELKAVRALEGDTAMARLTIWDINRMTDLVRIAGLVLEGEIARRAGELPRSIGLLREAAGLEDRLNYNEPPDWFFSVRHLLGQALLDAGRLPEAEAVYREDLRTYKENGWALMGLYQSVARQPGRTAEAEALKKRFARAWQWAEVKLTGSVL